MDDKRLQFWTLYLTRFAQGFGMISLITLLGPYITELDPTATRVRGDWRVDVPGDPRLAYGPSGLREW